MPTLTLEKYRSLVSTLPRPTGQHIDNFVKFVASAHSWYKRLPYFLPGIPFSFFLDASAGSARSISWLGYVKATPRTKCGFHHSWIPTLEYRERFGYLAYGCAEAAGFAEVKLRGRIVSADVTPTVVGLDGRLHGVPPQVFDTGTVCLTAVMHPLSAGYPELILRPQQVREVSWPAESGGQPTLEKILARCRELAESPFTGDEGLTSGTILVEEYLSGVDKQLNALLLPERKRQYQEAIDAAERVCALVYD